MTKSISSTEQLRLRFSPHRGDAGQFTSPPRREVGGRGLALRIGLTAAVLVLTAVSAYLFRDRWYDRFFQEATPPKTTQAAASTTPTAGPLPPAPPACGEGQDMLAAMSLRDKLAQLVQANFDLRPKGIIQMLDLLRPIYEKTAAYGHFGREDSDFTWEKTDKVDVLRQAAGLGEREGAPAQA